MTLSNIAWWMVKVGIFYYITKKVFQKVVEVIVNKFLYQPNSPSVELKFPENNPLGFRNPSEQDLEYDDIEIITKDKVKLCGWFIYHSNPKDYPTIIFFHGNAGNIGNRLANMKILFEESKANIVIVGYRGYGHSQGSPSESGLQLDSEAVLDWTLSCSNIDPSRIFVFGRSMGGAVSIYL
mmetsp:Transcript_23737/g.27294  ORF Transcript_23737/g.27294 Transcript_23737/m.27294 type:complete len:181 (+) Transcript_23737:24-566(+)